MKEKIDENTQKKANKKFGKKTKQNLYKEIFKMKEALKKRSVS